MANRETQVTIEVLRIGNPNVRATQAPIEFVTRGNPTVRLTQVAMEILVPSVPNPPPQLILEMMLP